MADGFHIDVTELTRLADDLSKTPARAMPGIERVMKAGAQRAKTNMQVAFATSRYFKRIERSVSYDRLGFGSRIGYEIGPDADRNPAGALAGIAVEGGANGGGGTVHLELAQQQAEIGITRDLKALMKEIL